MPACTTKSEVCVKEQQKGRSDQGHFRPRSRGRMPSLVGNCGQMLTEHYDRDCAKNCLKTSLRPPTQTPHDYPNTTSASSKCISVWSFWGIDLTKICQIIHFARLCYIFSVEREVFTVLDYWQDYTPNCVITWRFFETLFNNDARLVFASHTLRETKVSRKKTSSLEINWTLPFLIQFQTVCRFFFTRIYSFRLAWLYMVRNESYVYSLIKFPLCIGYGDVSNLCIIYAKTWEICFSYLELACRPTWTLVRLRTHTFTSPR